MGGWCSSTECIPNTPLFSCNQIYHYLSKKIIFFLIIILTVRKQIVQPYSSSLIGLMLLKKCSYRNNNRQSDCYEGLKTHTNTYLSSEYFSNKAGLKPYMHYTVYISTFSPGMMKCPHFRLLKIVAFSSESDIFIKTHYDFTDKADGD